MSFIREELCKYADKEYAEFQAKLTPTVKPESFIGVRVPDIRKIARMVEKNEEYESFLRTVPHTYYDENILHSILLGRVKDYQKCIELLEIFLPYIDNWAVCDVLRPKIFVKHRGEIITKIREWSASEHTYTCRFGVGMLMAYFLDEGFEPEYLEIPAIIKSDEYYVNMMVAWYFATALAKQWEDTIPYLTEQRLPVWTHNKTIQKARESYRITPEQKEYLKGLKR